MGTNLEEMLGSTLHMTILTSRYSTGLQSSLQEPVSLDRSTFGTIRQNWHYVAHLHYYLHREAQYRPFGCFGVNSYYEPSTLIIPKGL